MKVVTRFAPSPTGELHIGGARTALFNFLYSKHTGGIFRLRIEDTDKKRSTSEFEKSIISGLKWLGIDYDDEIIYQSQRESRHVEVARQLVELGHAYYCYTPLEEIQQKRQEFEAQGKVYQFQSEWRDKKSSGPTVAKPVIRLRAPREGQTTINDLVQGTVTVQNSELDDMVLLRSDGTPTYMFAVVVDDHDMEVTHVIRGDDHLNNAFRQINLYYALNWPTPQYGHIPLIHGADGSKLSKRHGALGVGYYKEAGYLPEALNNYLVRLGWGHGNDEIFSREQAIEWFDIVNVHRNPARLDFDKMKHINAQYIKALSDKELVNHLEEFTHKNFSEEEKHIMEKGMPGLKVRAKTLAELADNINFYISAISLSDEAKAIIDNADIPLMHSLIHKLEDITHWTEEEIKDTTKRLIADHNIELGEMAKVLRALLTGSTVSPSVFEIMYALGKENSIERLRYLK